MGRVRIGLTAALAMLVLPVAAQADSLADIRQELSALYGSISSLRGELVASGQATAGVAGNTPLERLDAIEAALQRLTSRTEDLEFRINRITQDGTNRIGDLEFRLCELEPGCDISMLGDTPSLGGVDNAANVPQPAPQQPTGPELTAGEQQDYRRAQEALAQGDFQRAADLFAAYVEAWPGGPMTAEALYHKGEALEGLGRISDAARAWLDSFSGTPDGPVAPDALLKLGTALGRMGQGSDACVTLGEVGLRFPTHPAAAQARSERARLGCP
ncbi:MAG: tol-pal system protein YbgF [Rubellimicrobium sp.]|nr:tol-pal system protein YbgF [Rubellimicrobium sp.]